MARKREKTETDGTGFGVVAVVEEAGTVAAATEGVWLPTVTAAVLGEELFSDVFSEVATACAGDDEFCVTPIVATLASACWLRDVAGGGGGEEESGAEAASPFALEGAGVGAVCTWWTTSGKPEFCSAD